MKPISCLHLAALLLALVVLPSCRKAPEPAEPAGRNIPLSDELRKNNLGGLPGAVHLHAADSPIHWQPWTPDIIPQAQKARRMIFAVVAMPQAPGFAESLDALAADPNLVEKINTNYLPVLVDGDAAREIGILCADLSAEIDRNVNLPFFIWMSPAGHPVAWIPSPWQDGDATRAQFLSSESLVESIWEESPKYVIENSAMDNEARQGRISNRRLGNIESENPKADTVRAIRQLGALYDPLSRNYDEVGGLFPSGAIDLLASAAMQPDIPADVRNRSIETLDYLLVDLLGSAMFDPLDGGLFSARRANTWSLPVFHRHSIAQARAALALFRAHQATGNAYALESALGLIDFNETKYQTSEGLYAIGLNPDTSPELWMWKTATVEQILGPEDAAWWARLTGMRALGNIAYEIDSEGRYFRLNTLAIKKPLQDLAAAEATDDAGAFRRRFDAAREKLLAARVARTGDSPRDDSSHAGASFRMVSAYAAAFTATGDTAWRDKAVALLERSRVAFSSGANLRVFSGEGPDSIAAARAFIYTLAIQAVLDVIDITGDDAWFAWCDDLATVMTEKFARDGFLREAPEEAIILDLPVTDVIMLFEESSVGVLNFAECRLAANGRPMVRELINLAGTLPMSATRYPIQHTDIIQSFLSRTYPVTVVHNDATSAELMEAIRRLPLRMIHRRPAAGLEQPPAGGGLVIRGDAAPIAVSTPVDLSNALLPDAPEK